MCQISSKYLDVFVLFFITITANILYYRSTKVYNKSTQGYVPWAGAYLQCQGG